MKMYKELFIFSKDIPFAGHNLSIISTIRFADGLISVHEYSTFKPKVQLHKSKGTSFFAIDLKVTRKQIVHFVIMEITWDYLFSL